MKQVCFALVVLALQVLTTGAQAPASASGSTGWSVTRNGNILQINYGTASSSPQYGALDLSSSYFRMNPGPPSGWGTSLILLPVFWSQSACPPPGLCQGALVQATWQASNLSLILTVTGMIGPLQVRDVVRLFPPSANGFSAQVTASVIGSVTLDNRPGEAFKPMMFSSMHVSSALWDTQAAYVGKQFFSLPASGWIIQPPVIGHLFGLQGGTSAWKTNAPTLQITWKLPLQVTGYVTASSNPNDDNVGFWAASTYVIHSYSYSVTSASASILPGLGR